MKLKKAEIRYLYELKKVLYDQEWLKKSPNFEIYYMYRGVKEQDNLRYDITVIPPKKLGLEFVKTKGHYHPQHYGELYIVLEGQAIYLMQKVKGEKIEDIYAVEAKRGDHIIIPPKYGHITINSGKKTLKMANWVYNNFRSVYEPIEKRGGGGYFYTTRGWLKNKNYKYLPNLRIEKAQKSKPKDLSFLKRNG